MHETLQINLPLSQNSPNPQNLSNTMAYTLISQSSKKREVISRPNAYTYKSPILKAVHTPPHTTNKLSPILLKAISKYKPYSFYFYFIQIIKYFNFYYYINYNYIY